MARADKSGAIAELENRFSNSSAVLLTEYRGLTVAQLEELRRGLAGKGEYVVAKNTLARIAAKNTGVEGLDNLLTGPTALVFVTGEVPEAAKVLRDFAKANDKLVIKGGSFEGSVMDEQAVRALADLESREVILAKAAGALKAALYKAAYVFTAPAIKAVRTIDALREKQESGN